MVTVLLVTPSAATLSGTAGPGATFEGISARICHTPAKPGTMLLNCTCAGCPPIVQLALDFGFLPVIPPRHNRLQPWQYDKALYRKRNEIERLFRRLKGFRRIFSRFDKLDVVFLAFLNFALIVEALR